MTASPEKRPPWMAQASRWLLALGIACSALAVGSVHTVTLCIVTGVLAVAAVLGWWGAEPSWAPITLDPIATRVEVLEGVAYLPFGVRKFLS